MAKNACETKETCKSLLEEQDTKLQKVAVQRPNASAMLAMLPQQASGQGQEIHDADGDDSDDALSDCMSDDASDDAKDGFSKGSHAGDFFGFASAACSSASNKGRVASSQGVP